MVTAKENGKMQKLKPELVQAIKDFLSTGMPVTEVSQKLSVPYHTVYHYSPLNKKRIARVKRQKLKAQGKSPTIRRATSVESQVQQRIEGRIAELRSEVDKINLQIETLQSLL